MQNTQDPYRSFKFPAPRDTSVKGKNFNPMMVSGFRPSCRCSFRIAAWAAELLRFFETETNVGCSSSVSASVRIFSTTTREPLREIIPCTLVHAQKHGARNASVRATLRPRQDGHSHPSNLRTAPRSIQQAHPTHTPRGRWLWARWGASSLDALTFSHHHHHHHHPTLGDTVGPPGSHRCLESKWWWGTYWNLGNETHMSVRNS